MNRPVQKIPGYNVDRLDVAAGLRELKTCGYDEPKTVMVIEYALRRWARDEEEAAQRGAIDRSFHGINLTCWLRMHTELSRSDVSYDVTIGDPSDSMSPRTARCIWHRVVVFGHTDRTVAGGAAFVEAARMQKTGCA